MAHAFLTAPHSCSVTHLRARVRHAARETPCARRRGSGAEEAVRREAVVEEGDLKLIP